MEPNATREQRRKVEATRAPRVKKEDVPKLGLANPMKGAGWKELWRVKMNKGPKPLWKWPRGKRKRGRSGLR